MEYYFYFLLKYSVFFLESIREFYIYGNKRMNTR